MKKKKQYHDFTGFRFFRDPPLPYRAGTGDRPSARGAQKAAPGTRRLIGENRLEKTVKV